MVAAWGGLASDLGVARDEPAELAATADRVAGIDLLVTLGGASVGERDLVRSALGARGLELDFWQIAMRPGKPLMFGTIGGVPLLGLPGNPVSAGVCAVLFVRAAICVMQGLDPTPPEIPAVLGSSLRPNDRRQEYLRARAEWDADGRLVATPAEIQDSSMLATFARADCLIRRAPFAPAMPPGTPVRCPATRGRPDRGLTGLRPASGAQRCGATATLAGYNLWGGLEPANRSDSLDDAV